MAALPTIAEVVRIGDISIALSSNDYSSGQYKGARKIKDTTPVLLAYVTDALRWHNEDFPNDTSLRGTANYAIWLYGKYGVTARAGTGGGGSVIPITPVVNTPNRLDFYVSDTTPIATGQDTISFPQFIGYNMDFYRGNRPEMQGVTDGFSTYFTWNKVTGIMVIVGPAAELEPMSILPYL